MAWIIKLTSKLNKKVFYLPDEISGNLLFDAVGAKEFRTRQLARLWIKNCTHGLSSNFRFSVEQMSEPNFSSFVWIIQIDGAFPDTYEENRYVIISSDFGYLLTLNPNRATTFKTKKEATQAKRQAKLEYNVHPEIVRLVEIKMELNLP